jgi:hypothetical protein
MFRKRRAVPPGFRIPVPFNPFTGKYAQFGPEEETVAAASNVVWMRNTHTSTIPQYTAMGCGDLTYTPGSEPDEYAGSVVLDGVNLGGGVQAYVGNWGILQQEAAPNAIVPAVIDGVTIAKISVTVGTVDYIWAEITSSTYYPRAWNCGSARIIWKESGYGGSFKWALLRLGTTHVPPLTKCRLSEDLTTAMGSCAGTTGDYYGGWGTPPTASTVTLYNQLVGSGVYKFSGTNGDYGIACFISEANWLILSMHKTDQA